MPLGATVLYSQLISCVREICPILFKKGLVIRKTVPDKYFQYEEPITSCAFSAKTRKGMTVFRNKSHDVAIVNDTGCTI